MLERPPPVCLLAFSLSPWQRFPLFCRKSHIVQFRRRTFFFCWFSSIDNSCIMRLTALSCKTRVFNLWRGLSADKQCCIVLYNPLCYHPTGDLYLWNNEHRLLCCSVDELSVALKSVRLDWIKKTWATLLFFHFAAIAVHISLKGVLTWIWVF